MMSVLAAVSLLLGMLMALRIALDLLRYPQPMKVMNWVWVLNALWGSVLVYWAYRSFGRAIPPTDQGTTDMSKGDMKGMDMPMEGMKDMDMGEMKGMDMSGGKPFWQSVAAGTLHCGAGCSMADLLGAWVFYLFPFALGGSLTAGEWTLDYLLALAIGVTFQYAALAPMLGHGGTSVWWRALKVDFLSLTSWQVGMYGWMAVVIFGLWGRIPPTDVRFWFMMQIAMLLGFLTAYPMNWLLIRKGVKSAM